MKFSINNLFKRLFKRRAPQTSQPLPHIEPQKASTAFQKRKSPPSRWLITHNRIVRQHTNKIRKRRAKNKMARHSRQISRRAAA